jgi:DNA repair protein RecN (Recombination protein N)
MLVRLSVLDFALFQKCDLELAPGLNALTGETGAGKSLLLDALDCILGGKAPADLIRKDRDSAQVEAFFTIDDGPLVTALCAILGAELPEGGLLLRRTLSRTGRSTAQANGRSVPVSVLKQAGDLIVDIHGQNEHQRLIKPSVQLEALDAYAGLEKPRARAAQAYSKLRESAETRSAILAEKADIERDSELLSHRVRELDAAAIKSDDELELLLARRQVAAHRQQIADTLSEMHRRLYEDDDSLNAAVERLAAKLSRLAQVLPEAERWNKLLDEASVLMGEAGREAGEFLDARDSQDESLERIDDRIAALRALCRKYGPTLADCRRTLETEKARLDALGSVDLRLKAAAKESESARLAFLEASSELSSKRAAGAARFARKIKSELAALGMAEADFRVDFHRLTELHVPEDVADASPSGLESCEFMLMPNPGEGWAPLARVASGGEIARTMLALKSVLAGADRTPVLVFDEIDADIGGRLGEAVGRKLRELSSTHQVMVVTHLPQIAAFAQNHIQVRKASRSGRTTAEVVTLRGDERLMELAEMLRGRESAAEAIDQARRMLKSGQSAQAARVPNGATREETDFHG